MKSFNCYSELKDQMLGKGDGIIFGQKRTHRIGTVSGWLSAFSCHC